MAHTTAALPPDGALYVEHRLCWMTRLLILAVLTPLALGFIGIGIFLWATGPSWGAVAMTPAALLFAAGLVGYISIYIVHGCKGHYLRADSDVLEVGEIEGRAHLSIPLESITQIVHDRGGGAGDEHYLRITTAGGSHHINEVDVMPTQFDGLIPVLRAKNPRVVIYRCGSTQG